MVTPPQPYLSGSTQTPTLEAQDRMQLDQVRGASGLAVTEIEKTDPVTVAAPTSGMK